MDVLFIVKSPRHTGYVSVAKIEKKYEKIAEFIKKQDAQKVKDRKEKKDKDEDKPEEKSKAKKPKK